MDPTARRRSAKAVPPARFSGPALEPRRPLGPFFRDRRPFHSLPRVSHMRRVLCAAFVLLAGTAPLRAENFALLVGVSGYPDLEAGTRLEGPANDIPLVRDYLTGNRHLPFDGGNVVVLADGVEGGEDPTLEAIRAGFADLAERVAPGDSVYVHFSGHGAQVPAADPATEEDGLDEVFLPVDAAPWDSGQGALPNALTDDEMGELIGSLRDAGADVWAVFDTAYSGAAIQGAPTGADAVRLRRILPETLSVPADAMTQAREAAPGPGDDPRVRAEPPLSAAEAGTDTEETGDRGTLTAFFAAQSVEQTPEMRLPRGQSDSRVQGVFTYTLFETLAERPGLTYRQLAQELLRKYGVKYLTRSVPVFVGDLDQRVFGGEAADAVLQWPAQGESESPSVSAGTLHGLEPGAELLMLSDPGDPDDEAIGRYRVAEATTFGANLDVVTGPGQFPEGAVLRKATAALDFSLTVAVPDAGTRPASKLEVAAAQISARGLLGDRVEFVSAGDEADVRLAVLSDSARPDAIWFFPGSGVVDESQLAATPAISTADKEPDALAAAMATTLERMAKAINLLRVASASSDPGLPLGGDFVAARFDSESGSVVEDSHRVIEPVNVPRLLPDDVIGVRLRNDWDRAVDYNVLYIGSDYSVTFMKNGRIEPGASLSEDYVRITDNAFGRDRMLVTLSAARETGPVESLAFLEQEGVEMLRGGTGLAALMGEAGLGQATRGSLALSSRREVDAAAATFLQLDVETGPRPE